MPISPITGWMTTSSPLTKCWMTEETQLLTCCMPSPESGNYGYSIVLFQTEWQFYISHFMFSREGACASLSNGDGGCCLIFQVHCSSGQCWWRDAPESRSRDCDHLGPREGVETRPVHPTVPGDSAEDFRWPVSPHSLWLYLWAGHYLHWVLR